MDYTVMIFLGLACLAIFLTFLIQKDCAKTKRQAEERIADLEKIFNAAPYNSPEWIAAADELGRLPQSRSTHLPQSRSTHQSSGSGNPLVGMAYVAGAAYILHKTNKENAAYAKTLRSTYKY